MTSILASLLMSGISILPSDDAVCAKAPKGWIRGVVRITTKEEGIELRTAPPAPKNAGATVRRLMPVKTGFLEEGIVGGSGVDENGTFGISIEPKFRGRLLTIEVHVQGDYETESEVVTFDPSLFKTGMCLEVFLNREKSPR